MDGFAFKICLIVSWQMHTDKLSMAHGFLAASVKVLVDPMPKLSLLKKCIHITTGKKKKK